MESKPELAEIHQAIACLQRLTDAFRRRREQLARSAGLTEHQWGLLEEISAEHFMPSMFARHNDSTPAAVSKTIRQLIDRDLVAVAVSPTDGRQRLYSLSATGKRLMSHLRRSREAAIADVWQGFDRNELLEFVRFGQSLVDRLERYAGHADQ